jgi:hypothetical protein
MRYYEDEILGLQGLKRTDFDNPRLERRSPVATR